MDLSLQQKHRKLAVEKAERMTVFGSSFSCLVGFFRLISPFGTLNRSSGQSLNPRSFAVEKKSHKLGQQHNRSSFLRRTRSWLSEKSLSRQCLKPLACLHRHPAAYAHTWCGFFQCDFSGSHEWKKSFSPCPPIPSFQAL